MTLQETSLEPIPAETVRVEALESGLKLTVKGDGRSIDVLIPVANVATLANMLMSAASLVLIKSGRHLGTGQSDN